MQEIGTFEAYEADNSILPSAKSMSWTYPGGLPKHHPKRHTNLEQATLPGLGSPGAECGEAVPYHCNSCGKPFWGARSCMERTCPSCYEKWAGKESREASSRVWDGRTYLYGQYGIRARLVHATVSVAYDGQSLEDLKARFRAIAKKHGLTGGAMIIHPFRSPDDGEWANDGTVHCHIVAVAPGNIIESKPGQAYVFKVIPDREHNDYRGFRSRSAVARCIRYQLTHAGIWEGRHALTWWGTMSYRKLPGKKLEEFSEAKDADEDPLAWLKLRDEFTLGPSCPHCGSRDTERCEQYDRDLRETLMIHPIPEGPPPVFEPPPPRLTLLPTWGKTVAR